METVSETPELWNKTVGSHRWYDDTYIVVDIDGMLLRYNGFYMTGDNCMSDMDLQYNFDDIIEVAPKQITVTTYEPV